MKSNKPSGNIRNVFDLKRRCAELSVYDINTGRAIRGQMLCLYVFFLLNNEVPNVNTIQHNNIKNNKEHGEQPGERKCNYNLNKVESSHLYLYSAFNNTFFSKQRHNIKIGKYCVNHVK